MEERRMSTIKIENPADWREGDHFTGSVHLTGVDFEVRGTLKSSTLALASGRLYVWSGFPYVDRVDRWQDITVLREVEEYRLGTIVRSSAGVRVKTDEGWVWINFRQNRSSHLGNTPTYGDPVKSEQVIREWVERGQETLVYDPRADEKRP
jgi:hypothetical protein